MPADPGSSIVDSLKSSPLARLRWSLGRLRHPRGRYYYLDETLSFMGLDEEEMRAVQLRRLKSVLGRAAKSVPYWRELFAKERFTAEAMTSADDLQTLPPLTKSIIREQGDRMISTDYDRATLKRRSTGGSTGEPLVFWVDRASFERQMSINLRSHLMAGIPPGAPIAKIWGYGNDMRAYNSLSAMTGEICLDSFRASPDDMESWYRAILNQKAAALYGYASAIHHFSRYLGQSGRAFPTLKVVCTTGEMLYPEMREEISKFLNVPVADMYGCHEVVRLASQCLRGGMHIAMDAAVLQFGDGASSTREGSGKIYLTSLLSSAMPFIRYDVGDSASAFTRQCECGCRLPLMSMDVGKVHHIFHLPGERQIHTTIFTKELYRIDALSAFQVRHTKPDEIQLVGAPRPGHDNEAKTALEKICGDCEKSLGGGVRIIPLLIEKIPLTKSGKLLSVTSEMPEDKLGKTEIL